MLCPTTFSCKRFKRHDLNGHFRSFARAFLPCARKTVGIDVEGFAPSDPVQQNVVCGMHNAGEEDSFVQILGDVVLLHGAV